MESQNPRRIPLNVVRIDFPCTEDWSQMEREGDGFYCRKCAKHVHDLDGKSDAEIGRLLGSATDRVCVRYTVPAPTAKRPRPFWRRMKLAAGMAGLAVWSMMATGCDDPRVTAGRAKSWIMDVVYEIFPGLAPAPSSYGVGGGIRVIPSMPPTTAPAGTTTSPTCASGGETETSGGDAGPAAVRMGEASANE